MTKDPAPYTAFIVRYSGYKSKLNKTPDYHTDKRRAEREAKLNNGGLYYSIQKVLMWYAPNEKALWQVKAILQTWHYYPNEIKQLA